MFFNCRLRLRPIATIVELNEQFEDAVPERLEVDPREAAELKSIADVLQMLEMVSFEQHFLEVGEHVDAAVMGVGLAGQLQ